MVTLHASRTGNRRSESSYARIEEDIRRKIRVGIWPLGTKIPSRLTLTKQYDVDLRTVQKAVGRLLAEGVLKSDGTLGTYVATLLHDPVFGSINDGVSLTAAEAAIDALEAANLSLQVAGSSTDLTDMGLVGLIASDDPNKYMGYMVAQAMEHELLHTGRIRLHYYDLFDGTNIPAKPLADGVDAMFAKRVRSLCMLFCPHESVDEMMARSVAEGVKLVFVSDTEIMRPISQVYYDNRYDGYVAAKHLIDTGANELVFVDVYDMVWSRDRASGADSAALYAGWSRGSVRRYPESLSEGLVLSSGNCTDFGRDLIRDGFRKGALRGGIICANDLTAYAVLDVAAELGLRAGDDFQLIGFDNWPESMRRGMSSMQPPLAAMGREVARMMLDGMGETRGPSMVKTCLHSQLVPRSTSVKSTG
ncbi:MAG TPA: substrate-binding domain-containing protein [Capsulimonadaceae bacterium]|jgi:DNA-binding LacI/PurR family transcriptional regulator